MMKKLILLAAGVLCAVALNAQVLSLNVPENVPEQAREILVQRFTQMLLSGGVAVGEGGETLFIEAEVTNRMETLGSSSQTALSIDIRAFVSRNGETLVEETWSVKGVGADENDAWVRASKMILPRSKAATAFVSEIKSKL